MVEIPENFVQYFDYFGSFGIYNFVEITYVTEQNADIVLSLLHCGFTVCHTIFHEFRYQDC